MEPQKVAIEQRFINESFEDGEYEMGLTSSV